MPVEQLGQRSVPAPDLPSRQYTGLRVYVRTCSGLSYQFGASEKPCRSQPLVHVARSQRRLTSSSTSATASSSCGSGRPWTATADRPSSAQRTCAEDSESAKRGSVPSARGVPAASASSSSWSTSAVSGSSTTLAR